MTEIWKMGGAELATRIRRRELSSREGAGDETIGDSVVQVLSVSIRGASRQGGTMRTLSPAREPEADCGPPVNPISCAARRRIRAIENCVSRLLPSLVQRQVTMLVALADRLNPTSRHATLQPPLAYCVTEFGRLFVRRHRDGGGKRNDNRHHRRITTQSSDRCGIRLSVCAAAGDLRRVLCTHPTHRLPRCRANGAEHHGARTALPSGYRQ